MLFTFTVQCNSGLNVVIIYSLLIPTTIKIGCALFLSCYFNSPLSLPGSLEGYLKTRQKKGRMVCTCSLCTYNACETFLFRSCFQIHATYSRTYNIHIMASVSDLEGWAEIGIDLLTLTKDSFNTCINVQKPLDII